MGREIRKVAPGWEHPRYTEDDVRYDPSWMRSRIGRYKPLYDGSYAEAKREWLEGLAAWEAGTHPDLDPTDATPGEYWDEWSPPKRADYCPDWAEGEATWFQVYETVSEGTPITPAFATEAELVEFLCTQADFCGDGPRSRDVAERFVRGGWVPSMVIVGGAVYSNIDACAVLPPAPGAGGHDG